MEKNSRIIIGCDHAGFELKQHIKKLLTEQGIGYKDVGAMTSKSTDDYPVFISQIASAVSSGEFARGIAIDGSGVGSSIVANRYPHVRAALCMNSDVARLARAHTDSNILVLGSWMTSTWSASEILSTWLKTKFEGGRHTLRIGLIDDGRRLDVALDHLSSIEAQELASAKIDDRTIHKASKAIERLRELFWPNNRRTKAEERFSGTYPSTVICGSEKFSALMIELSDKGARFRPSSAAKKFNLKSGDAVNLEIRTPYGTSQCSGVVAWVDRAFYISFGVQFTRLSNDKKDPLRCLMGSW
jgi:ribose 5-phosphate isomerase B